MHANMAKDKEFLPSSKDIFSRRISFSLSSTVLSSMMVVKKVVCVFVVWTVLSSRTDGAMKMTVLSATSDSSGTDNSDSPSTGGPASLPQCVLKGRMYTERLWYGYLIDKAFHRDYAKIQYTISYPVKECCTNLLIYYDDQIKQLTRDMSCEERERILPSNNNQVIPLHTLNHTVGCRVWNESQTEEPYYVCVGERIFRSSGPRTWYFALSRCRAKTALTLNYSFNVSGYYGECEEDPLVRTYIPPSPKEDNNIYLSLALGVVAGVAVIAAVVFFALWFLARRRAANSKGSSVTSSQATMTQDDIFYVNPSLSDRGEHQEYGQSQTSSENYYEVIPERRSYESINPHLLAAGGPGSHHPLLHPHPHFSQLLHPAHAHGVHSRQAHFHPGPHSTQLKESAFHRPHPAGMGYPMFDDYPPPPYQPPRLLGGPKHHTLHHPPSHHPPSHHHTLSMPPGPRPRPPLLSPSHAATLSFTSILSPAPSASPLAAILNNNTSNNNNLITGISSNSPISMNTSTNVVTLGETTA